MFDKYIYSLIISFISPLHHSKYIHMISSRYFDRHEALSCGIYVSSMNNLPSLVIATMKKDSHLAAKIAHTIYKKTKSIGLIVEMLCLYLPALIRFLAISDIRSLPNEYDEEMALSYPTLIKNNYSGYFRRSSTNTIRNKIGKITMKNSEHIYCHRGIDAMSCLYSSKKIVHVSFFEPHMFDNMNVPRDMRIQPLYISPMFYVKFDKAVTDDNVKYITYDDGFFKSIFIYGCLTENIYDVVDKWKKYMKYICPKTIYCMYMIQRFKLLSKKYNAIYTRGKYSCVSPKAIRIVYDAIKTHDVIKEFNHDLNDLIRSIEFIHSWHHTK